MCSSDLPPATIEGGTTDRSVRGGWDIECFYGEPVRVYIGQISSQESAEVTDTLYVPAVWANLTK